MSADFEQDSATVVNQLISGFVLAHMTARLLPVLSLVVVIGTPGAQAQDSQVPAFVQAGTNEAERGRPSKGGEIVSGRAFGMVADGSPGSGTDNSIFLQKAIDAAVASGGVLVIPRSAGRYRFTHGVTIRGALRMYGDGATFLFDFPASTSNALGRLIDIKASNVTIDGLTIDGTGVIESIPGVNRYGIVVDGGATRYSDIGIVRCRFTNLTQSSGSIPATTTVVHPIFLNHVDRPHVVESYFDSISGTAVSLRDTTHARVVRNDFVRFGWSGLALSNANYDWLITDNTFSGTTADNPSYWGGAIDVMGQTSDQVSPGLPDERGLIAFNRFDGGYYSYGQVLRLSSSHDVIVSSNIFNQNDVEQGLTGQGHQNLITVGVRDVTRNNGPHKNIQIVRNTFIAKGKASQVGIWASASSGSNVNTTPCEGLTITDNLFACPDSDNCFGQNISVFGANAGYKGILIANNVMKAIPGVYLHSLIALPGNVLVYGARGKTVERVNVLNNSLEYFDGTGTINAHTGVNIQTDVTDVIVEGNDLKNFYRCITVGPGNKGNVPVMPNNCQPAPGGSAYNLRGVALDAGGAPGAR